MEFKITFGPIPPRIAPGGDHDPIYDPLSRRGFDACIAYYQRGEKFLSGESRRRPSIESVLRLCVPHGSIFNAQMGEADEYGDKLEVWIEDLEYAAEARMIGPRWFAPDYFPGIMLLTAPGGSIRHNYTTRKKDTSGNWIPREQRRSHLSFGRGADQNIRLLRILCDAKPGFQIHRKDAGKSPDWHREYRSRALFPRFDEESRKSFGGAGYSTKGRISAFNAAAYHWDLARELGRKLPNETMTGADFRKLLMWAFDIADRLQCKLSLI